MSKKSFMAVNLDPFRIGERFDREEENHGGDQLEAIDAMIRASHMTGMILADLRKLLEYNEDAVITSIADGLVVDGLEPEALQQAVQEGLLEEVEYDEDDTVPVVHGATTAETSTAVTAAEPAQYRDSNDDPSIQ